MRVKCVLVGWRSMRTTLELPDPLFARLKAQAACEQKRYAATLPRLQGPLAIQADQLNNAALFELLDA